MSRHPTPDPIDVDVGLRIYSRRTELGMSQKALGDALGVSFQQVQKYERGRNRISASVLVKAAKMLRVQPGALLPDSDAPPLPQIFNLVTQIRGLDTLADTYAAIKSSKRRNIVIVLARALAEEEAAQASEKV